MDDDDIGIEKLRVDPARMQQVLENREAKPVALGQRRSHSNGGRQKTLERFSVSPEGFPATYQIYQTLLVGCRVRTAVHHCFYFHNPLNRLPAARV